MANLRPILLRALLGNILIERWWLEGGEGGRLAIKDLQWYLKRYLEEWRHHVQG